MKKLILTSLVLLYGCNESKIEINKYCAFKCYNYCKYIPSKQKQDECLVDCYLKCINKVKEAKLEEKWR